MRDLLRGASGHDGTAAAAALRAEVNDIIRALDDIEVMLDHDDRVACIDQLIQHLDKAVNIRHMQTRGGLVQNIDGLAGITAGQLIGKLYTLGFAESVVAACPN